MKKRRSLVHVAGLLFGEPLLLEQAKADVLATVFKSATGEKFAGFFDDEDEDDPSPDRSYRMTPDGIAIIGIEGTLVRRSFGMNALSGLASYDCIGECVAQAKADPACLGAVLNVDSRGGEAKGCFDLAREIAAFGKPLYAVADGNMCSGAYALACGADVIYASSDADVGSVGVLCMHLDESQADKQDGLKWTTFKYGEKKDLGNPHEPLSTEAKTHFQERVDEIGDAFTALVAENRDLTVDAVRGMQAGIYSGTRAVSNGLADQIGDMDDALAAMREKLGLPVPVEEAEDDGAALPVSDMAAATFDSLVALADLAHPLARDAMASGQNAFVTRGNVLHFRRAPKPLALAGETGSQKVTGCAIPYNSLSSDLGGFKEVYEAGCFSESIQRDDVRFLANHDPSCVIGRTSAGTARLTERADGVYADADGPDTTWFADLAVSMARGDITGMSSAFYIQKHRWEMRDGMKVRVIEKGRLVDVTTATFPVYESATLQQQTPAAGVPPAVIESLRARLRVLNLA